MEILKKELKLKGFTIKAFSDKLNVSENAIYLWLSGTFLPKPVHIKKMLEMGFSEEAVISPSKEVEV